MSSKSEITIVIPAYNAEKTLYDCINSILAQTFSEWHLIIVDDGSRDSTSQICKSFTSLDSRIEYVCISNSGPGAARNTGIFRCKSPWITFIDADDEIEPEFLENFHHLSLSKGDLSVQGFKRVLPDGTMLSEKKEFPNIFYSHDNIVICLNSYDFIDYGQSVGKLYCTATLKEYNLLFPTDFRLSEDHYFFFNYLLHVHDIKLNGNMYYRYIDWPNTTSLSRRLPPANDLLIRHNALILLTDIFRKQYNISDKKVVRFLDNLAYTGAISLLLQSTYKDSSLDDGQRRKVLSQIHQNWTSKSKYFHPASVPGKVVKLLLFGPVRFSNFIFRYTFK